MPRCCSSPRHSPPARKNASRTSGKEPICRLRSPRAARRSSSISWGSCGACRPPAAGPCRSRRPGSTSRQPRFSPDGERVVYQRRSGDQWDVWLLELATGEQRPLTMSPFDEREPDFTPDGRAVVFATNRTGHYCLWSIALDGGVETQLTEETGEASYPAVSEHGLVAYVLARAGEWSIRVLGSDGVISVAHTSSSRLSAPTWRPGGGVLVFGEQDSTETSRLQMLLLGQPHVLKSLSDGEDLFASRAAWRSAAEFIYAADGQLWRRGIATPTREPVHLFAAAAVEVAVPPAGYRAVRCARRAFRTRGERRREVARRPQHCIHGARRSLACRARRATPPDERRVRRPRSNLLARRRVVGLRKRAHRPV